MDCERKIILDNEEKFPVHLDANNLRLCAGPYEKDESRIEGLRYVKRVE